MTRVNIIIGRFQPITTGHLKCIEMAKQQTGCPTVLCIIDTPESKVDSRHPFPTSRLISIYKDIFAGGNIINIVPVKNADIVKISELLESQGYKIQSWTCGTDRISAYGKMASRYAVQANLPDDFRMIEVKRSDADESATKLREALIADNKQEFDRLSPHTDNQYYQILREHIMTVL